MGLPHANWNYPTAIRFGAGRIVELAEVCRSLGIARPLLVTDPALAQLPMVREQSNPVEYFEEEIKPEMTPGSQIIKVTLSGKDPVEIATLVNAVVDF